MFWINKQDDQGSGNRAGRQEWDESRSRGLSSRHDYTEDLRHPSEFEPDQPSDAESAETEFYLRIGVLVATGVVLLMLAYLLAPGFGQLVLLSIGTIAALGIAAFVFWSRQYPEQAQRLAWSLRERFGGRR